MSTTASTVNKDPSLYTKKKVNTSSRKKSPPQGMSNLNTISNASFHNSMIEDNQNQNISNYLANQFLSDEIINGSSFCINDIPSLRQFSVPLATVKLIQELIKHKNIRMRVVDLIKPRKTFKRKKIFTLHRIQNYLIDFLSIYNENHIAKVLKKSDKIYSLKTSFRNRNSQKDLNLIITENSHEIDESESKNSNSNNAPQTTKNNQNFRVNYNLDNSNIKGENANGNHDYINTEECNRSSKKLGRFSRLSSMTIGNKPLDSSMHEKPKAAGSSTTLTSLLLTKIPQKKETDENDRQLDYAYNKAKNAARVVRRLEYSYNMKISLMYSKPIHKKSAKIIQKWWRNLIHFLSKKGDLINIQKYVRGMLARKAYKQASRIYKEILPFLKKVDEILSRRFCEMIFEKMIPEYALLAISNAIKPKAQSIIHHMNRYAKEMKFNRCNKVYPKKFLAPCKFTKITLDKDTNQKLVKIQANIKRFLMHSSEKIRKRFGDTYHPYLYYKLKYNTNIYKKKIIGFKKCVDKVKELNLKANKGLNNKYEYLSYILKKIHWDNFKKLYNESLNEVDESKVKIRKLRKLLRTQNKKRTFLSLKEYFERWRLYNKAYERYIKPSICDKLKYIDLVMKYHKKFDEKIFLYRLQCNKLQQEENEENALSNLTDIYDKYHNDEYKKKLLKKYFNKWNKANFLEKVKKSGEKMNKFFSKALTKFKEHKKEKVFSLVVIYTKYIGECLKRWKFENFKFKVEAKRFYRRSKKEILDTKRRTSLMRNFQSLEKRQKYFKRCSFKKYKVHTGMDYRKSILSNIQVSFFHKKRKFCAARKYRMLKYVINKMNNEKRINHWEKLFQLKFNCWRNTGKYRKFYTMLRKYLKIKSNIRKVFIRNKFVSWACDTKRWMLNLKAIYIQQKIRSFLRRRNKKL